MTLLVFVVGILLVAFGSLTLLFSWKTESFLEILYYYLLIKVVLWGARVALELLYPVKLSMFYVEPFTMVVLPGLLFELLLFFVAAILVNKARIEEKPLIN